MKLSNEDLEKLTAQMSEIAGLFHYGQTRNDGTPYIAHPKRVAAAVELRLKPIAWGHDLFEDTEATFEILKEAGIPQYVLDAIDVLTHKNKEPNLQYWARIKQNPDALAVKLADINDNINDHPSERAKAKYVLALKFFSEP